MPDAAVETLRRQATDALRAGRFAQTDAICRRLLETSPNDEHGLYLLCCTSRARGRFAEAGDWARRGIAKHPRDPRFHVELGSALAGDGDFEGAVRSYDRALEIDGRNASAIAYKADTLSRSGDRESARGLLEKYLEAGGDEPSAAAVYARVLHGAGEHEMAINVARRFLDTPSIDPYVRSNLNAAIARSCERLARYDEAFEAYASSHPKGARPFDAGELSTRFDRVIEAFSRDALASLPSARHDSDLPVFIVGMPRSGSTLVEQIIHAHPAAHGAGELGAMNEILHGLRKLMQTERPYPECVSELTQDHVDKLGEQYLETLRRAGGWARRVTDKALENYRRLGLIQLLCPGARVIHCRRDPLDTCFSCFSSNLSPAAFPYITDLRSLGLVYRQYERLMEHWAVALDLPVLEVVYEDAVEDPETTMRRIISFCDLNWDDRCLRFHEEDRPVLTASHEQVKRPIYRSSVGRAEAFGAHLDPLREALGDTLGGRTL